VQRFEQVWGLPPIGSVDVDPTGPAWQAVVPERLDNRDDLATTDNSRGPSGAGKARPWSADPLADPLGAALHTRLPDVSGRALAALNPGRRAVKALAAVAAIVVVISAFLAWHSRPSTVSVNTPLTGPATARRPAAGTTAAGTLVPPAQSSPTASSDVMLVVAVEGKVKRPGLVRLPPGSRIADAIAGAGGALPGTDLSFVNLAQKVVDGQLIVVGVALPLGAAATAGSGAAPGAGGSGGLAAGAPINLNSATGADLDTLPGIGPALAQRIIDYRTQHSGFRTVDELRNVSGIGDAKFADIKDLVTV
jgi:competence protein ComEA